jgi:hypothetical protein
MARFVTVTQGEVFYMTQALAEIEGMERGPAGNTSLAAAFALAREMEKDRMIVVQETEYTGAGKHPLGQLNLAKQMGILVRRGDPTENKPGKEIVIPEHPSQIQVVDIDLDRIRRSYLRNALKTLPEDQQISGVDVQFLADDTKTTVEYVKKVIQELGHEGQKS